MATLPDQPEAFEFNEAVAQVFDDMVERSVPRYADLQKLIAQLALKFFNGGHIYDLGCSTGNTIINLLQLATRPLSIVAVDSSSAMLNECKLKVARFSEGHDIQFILADVQSYDAFSERKPSVVILSLICQFLRPLDRPLFLRRVCSSLVSGGCLLMVEKTMEPNRTLHTTFVEMYHQFKLANGYTALEIARKREALENRLIPFSSEENVKLLQEAGFQSVSVFFTWLNFQAYIGIKQ